jgi:hypothetical protein
MEPKSQDTANGIVSSQGTWFPPHKRNGKMRMQDIKIEDLDEA